MTRSRPLLATLTHPGFVGSLGLLIVNDHVLKNVSPSWTTGKLSDFAGLVFFPLLLGATIEIIVPSLTPSRVVLFCCIAATGAVFALVKVIPVATEFYETVMGVVQWPIRSLLVGGTNPVPVRLTADPTDLFALPALYLSWRIGIGSLRRAGGTKQEVTAPHRIGAG